MKVSTRRHSSDPPRVLFLTSSAFNHVTGGGITFTNLFKGWPSDAIATVHSDPVPVAMDVCQKYFPLTKREIHWWGWLRYLSPGGHSIDMPTVVSATSRRRFWGPMLQQIKKWIFGDGVPQGTCLSTELEAWVIAFRPTVLYTILGSNAMMELAEELRVRFCLPLVVHMMDDWPAVLYKGGLLSPLQRAKKGRLIQHLMDVAAARFAICEDMAQAYEVRYKTPFQWFQNAIDVDLWQRFVKDAATLGKPIRLAYLGSVHPFAQLDSLIDCCRAIQELYEEGMEIRLEIYSPAHLAEQYRNQLVVGPAISLQDSITEDELFFRTLQAVDILLLPVNFDQHTVDFIRYSMPTKVPAYLTVGTPILAYGPAEVAQISYASKAGWALPVTVRDMVALKQGIKQLATDRKLRTELSTRARQLAASNHDARVVRNQFQTALFKAVNNTPA